MNEKVLITGGTGMVGRSLNFDNCIKVSSKDFDLRIPKATFELFEKENPQFVVHCAAKVGGLIANVENKGEFYYDNIMINTNVLEASRIGKVKKVLSFLSTCVFPENATYPLTEEQMHNGEPHSSNYPYAYAKRMIDIQSRAYREQYGCNFISVIPVNLYGPHDNFNLNNSHVVPALIRKCYEAKKNKSSLIVWGSGKPLREFVYIDDISYLTSWALENYQEEEPIIFTSSQEASIEELVQVICKSLNFKGKVIYDNSKPDGQIRKPSSNHKICKYLPNFKFTSLEEGISNTCEWFVKNYEGLRK